jgi:hypothetical protein
MPYKLIPITRKAREWTGDPPGSQASHIDLHERGTTIGRGVAGPPDFRLHAQWIPYSSKHCKITFDSAQVGPLAPSSLVHPSVSGSY